MNPRIEKLKAERDKAAKRIESLSEHIKQLDAQITRLENTDIIGIVRENGLSAEQLAKLIEILEKNPTASLPETFIKTEEK